MNRNFPVIQTIRPGQLRGVLFETKDDNPPPPEKLDITQEKLNELIQDAFARGAKGVEKKFEAEVSGLKKQIADLEKEKPAPVDDKTKTIPVSELAELKKKWLAEEIKPELDKRDNQIKTLLNSKRDAEIITEASKANVVNPQVLAKLIGDSVGYDDEGAIVIRDANGKERLGKAGLMTVGEFVAESLKDHPYLVKSNVQPGGGSGAPKGQGGVDVKSMSAQEKIAHGLAQQNQARDEFA